MKKFVVNILIFFAIVLTIDFTVGFFGDYLTCHVRSGDTKRTYDLSMKDCHDVLILGSSRARHHYDAPFLSDTLGLDVYNAGYDGNGIVLAYGLLEMILERYQPKLILYDVEPAFDVNYYEPDNNHKRYITRLKPYYHHKAVGNIIEDVSSEEWYKVHSGMVRYNMSLLTMYLDNFRPNIDSRKGYSPLYGEYDREPDSNGEENDLDHFKLRYIEKIITLANSRHVPIVFVASPKYGKTSSDDIKPVIDICKNNDVVFLDFYSDTKFMQHKDWFKEPMHLNEKGAKEFSSILAKNISEFISMTTIITKNH